jgi:RecB family exonuclease
MAMALPSNFQFSQASLQDFTDCKRRFYYRYIEHLSWPALESEPAIENERFMQQGAAFHQLVHQYILGIPEDRLAAIAEAEGFSEWWTNFIIQIPFDKKDQLFPESGLTTVIDQIRLQAKFDLVVNQKDGKFTIFDWKTSRKRPTRDRMLSRLQSKVYPYVLAQSGRNINQGQDITPGQITMIYWYPNFPDNPEVMQYNRVQFQEDESYLTNLIEKIVNLDGIASFDLTLNEHNCRYCVYRSLCDRGKSAGDLEEDNGLLEKEDFDIDIDFDQIAEIEY